MRIGAHKGALDAFEASLAGFRVVNQAEARAFEQSRGDEARGGGLQVIALRAAGLHIGVLRRTGIVHALRSTFLRTLG